MPTVKNIWKMPYQQQDADNFEHCLKGFIAEKTDPRNLQMGVLQPKLITNPRHPVNQPGALAHPSGRFESPHWTRLRTTIQDLRALYADGKSDKAFGTNLWLLELGRYVAFTCGGQLCPGPAKQFRGALAKLGLAQTGLEREDHYKGDVKQLKDVFRITLVGNTNAIYRAMALKITQTCTPENGMSIAKNVTRVPTGDPYGYSDTNIVAILPNKRFGEIQLNNRAILYGKMSAESFCRNILQIPSAGGVLPAEYQKFADDYGLMGGRGHLAYEVGERGGHTAADIARARRLSREYYAALRSPPESTEARNRLNEEVEAFYNQFHT